MVEQYFKNREQSEQVVFQKLLDDVKAAIPEQLLKFLPYISFIMLKPDAYLRGLAPSILKFLKENNVYPVKFKLKELQARDIDSLYMFVKPKYQESWWIMDKIYKLAPTCPAIVVGKPEGHEHLSSRIRDLVGPTTPVLGSESNIRYKFRGAHRIFNLIHGTDDPASAIREGLVFFDISDISHALEMAAMLHREGTSPDLPASSLQELRPGEAIELNLPAAKHSLKRALYERFRSELGAAEESLQHHAGKIKLIGRLNSLASRFNDLLGYENSLINESFPPRQEKELLLNGYYFQLRACSLAQDTLREAIFELSRDSNLQHHTRKGVLSRLVPIQKCFEIIRALTTDVEFKESPFDIHLAWLNFLNIPLDNFDEANLHAAWSVLATELNDFELKYPEQPAQSPKE